MISSIWGWLTSGASWVGADGIGTRVLEHLWLSGLVVVLAAVIALPLGVWIGHSGRAQWLISAANAARAVPTLGLLFIASLVVGPLIRGSLAFTLPAVLVLVLLAIPPLLAGAHAGVSAVDPAVRDAAYGIGMTPSEVLRSVELPCAFPLLWSGVRSAVLQVVATATIAAYVGLGGLGRFLIDGLAAGDYGVTAGGALVVALLALAVDGVLAAAGRLGTSPGLRPARGGGNSGNTRRARGVAGSTA